MPLREYECKKCKHRFEKIEKFSDKPLKKCPECGGSLEQLLSAPAVQFKGSGWYVTDYAKKSASASSASSSESETAGKEAAKDAGKEASKETKKEEKPKADTSQKKDKED